MSDTTLTGRLREFIDTYRGVDNLGYTGLMFQAADELDRLRAENARLIEDRARFPDRPDDIGRMIGSRFNNLKAAADENETRCLRAMDAARSAEADAARYRWLLANYARGDGWTAIDKALNDGEADTQLSPAIDAAMAQQQASVESPA